jgi:hypothetical protein
MASLNRSDEPQVSHSETISSGPNPVINEVEDIDVDDIAHFKRVARSAISGLAQAPTAKESEDSDEFSGSVGLIKNSRWVITMDKGSTTWIAGLFGSPSPGYQAQHSHTSYSSRRPSGI